MTGRQYGISWTVWKSFAPSSRQITMPVIHHSFFTGRMLFLTPIQQCQSTEGNMCTCVTSKLGGKLEARRSSNRSGVLGEERANHRTVSGSRRRELNERRVFTYLNRTTRPTTTTTTTRPSVSRTHRVTTPARLTLASTQHQTPPA